MPLSKGKLCCTSAVIVGVCGRLARPVWVQCVPDSHRLFSCAWPNATGELCVTMTNHSLCAPPSGWWRSGREGWMAGRQTPPLQSAVAILRIPTCVFMLVLCWCRLVCCCCADSLHCLHRENESAHGGRRVVFTRLRRVAFVYHVAAVPLCASYTWINCSCFFLAANLQQMYTKSWRVTLQDWFGFSFLFWSICLFFFWLGICDSYPWRGQSALLCLFFYFCFAKLTHSLCHALQTHVIYSPPARCSATTSFDCMTATFSPGHRLLFIQHFCLTLQLDCQKLCVAGAKTTTLIPWPERGEEARRGVSLYSCVIWFPGRNAGSL